MFLTTTKTGDNAGFILRKPLGYLVENGRLLETCHLLRQKLFDRVVLTALTTKSASGAGRFELAETTLRTIGADLVGMEIAGIGHRGLAMRAGAFRAPAGGLIDTSARD